MICLSLSFLSLSAGTYAHLPSLFLPPVTTCSLSLCSSRTSRKPQFKLSCGITRTREVVSLKSPFPVYLCPVSHTALYSDLFFFFPLCCALHPLQFCFFLFEEIRATQRLVSLSLVFLDASDKLWLALWCLLRIDLTEMKLALCQLDYKLA